MKYFTHFTLIAITLCLVACQTPNQPNSVPLAKVRAQLPSDWIDLAPSDPKMAYLDPVTRKSLIHFRKSLAAERSTLAYGFHGGYSDATYTKMREMNEECNKSYCANAVVIGRDE
ncbi:MAG: hypothetical protein O3B75_11130, partial [Planctomycetota bacterium]|nr:hypothetical protein [Planctomycetota bacterium]